MNDQIKPIHLKMPAHLYKGRVAFAVLTAVTWGLTLTAVAVIPGAAAPSPNEQVVLWVLFGVMGIGIATGCSAMVHLFHGLRDWIRPTAHLDGPGAFADPHDVRRGMSRNPLSAHTEMAGLRRWMFGPLTAYLAPIQRQVFLQLTGHLVLKLVLGGFVALSLLGQMFMVGGYGGAAAGAACIGLVGMLVCRLIACFVLVPKRAPDLGGAHDSCFYQGFGNPMHLFTRLPHLGDVLGRAPFGNRCTVHRDEDRQTAVTDNGTFQGSLFIEQQPALVQGEASRGAGFLVVAGWVLQWAAVVLAGFMMAALKGGDVPLDIVLWPCIVGGLLFDQGRRFFKHGYDLTTALRFRSTAVVIDLQGSYARANVSVGKGRDDSIGSDNLTVRSEFTATFRAAELLSMAADCHGPRHLVSLRPTEEAHAWVAHFKEQLHALRGTRLTPVGVALQSEELEELSRANHVLAVRRATEARGGARLAGASAEAPGLPASPDDSLKECPDCAERVRAKARKCRYCGHAFAADAAPAA